jgi:hypothetical protein
MKPTHKHGNLKLVNLNTPMGLKVYQVVKLGLFGYRKTRHVITLDVEADRIESLRERCANIFRFVPFAGRAKN